MKKGTLVLAMPAAPRSMICLQFRAYVKCQIGCFCPTPRKGKSLSDVNKPLLSSSSSKALLMAVGPLYRQAKLHAAIFVERVASPRPAKRPATEISSSSSSQ
jgi:hypothetical protein